MCVLGGACPRGDAVPSGPFAGAHHAVFCGSIPRGPYGPCMHRDIRHVNRWLDGELREYVLYAVTADGRRHDITGSGSPEEAESKFRDFEYYVQTGKITSVGGHTKICRRPVTEFGSDKSGCKASVTGVGVKSYLIRTSLCVVGC